MPSGVVGGWVNCLGLGPPRALGTPELPGVWGRRGSSAGGGTLGSGVCSSNDSVYIMYVHYTRDGVWSQYDPSLVLTARLRRATSLNAWF